MSHGSFGTKSCRRQNTPSRSAHTPMGPLAAACRTTSLMRRSTDRTETLFIQRGVSGHFKCPARTRASRWRRNNIQVETTRGDAMEQKQCSHSRKHTDSLAKKASLLQKVATLVLCGTLPCTLPLLFGGCPSSPCCPCLCPSSSAWSCPPGARRLSANSVSGSTSDVS